ncbi:MAG: menaquinone biosynthesis decarboxylase, partial [Chitinophagaceae bacterium]
PEIVDMDMPVEGVAHNLVIAQIKKDYAGQGQKVMNAMWGAGQMMFNKILVLTDEGTPIQDYKTLAQYVFRNLNPATDIYFSQGPMDVLDHSCSKLGYGGKMCLDGTAKHDEEVDDRYVFAQTSRDLSFIPRDFPEVKSVNAGLLQQDIPVLLLSVEKERPNQLRELHGRLAAHSELEGVKLILYIEHNVDAADLGVALWRFCNNLDPRRDSFLYEGSASSDSGRRTACLGMDGTRKTAELDGFGRDWPNIIVADEATIRTVDEKWETLGIGPFLSSPSLRFRAQMYGEEAVAS